MISVQTYFRTVWLCGWWWWGSGRDGHSGNEWERLEFMMSISRANYFPFSIKWWNPFMPFHNLLGGATRWWQNSGPEMLQKQRGINLVRLGLCFCFVLWPLLVRIILFQKLLALLPLVLRPCPACLSASDCFPSPLWRLRNPVTGHWIFMNGLF